MLFRSGDNWPSDNELCLRLLGDLLEQSNQFGYGEIRQGRYSYQSTLMHTFERIDNRKFATVTISDKGEVYPALRHFFGPEVGSHD